MTQEDLVDKVGLTDKYISDLERGLFAPRFEKLLDIAEALNIEAYKLIKDENNTSDLSYRYDRTNKKFNKKQMLLSIK